MGFGPESCIMMSHLKFYVNIFALSPWGICKMQTHYNPEFSILHLVQGTLRKLAGCFKGSFFITSLQINGIMAVLAAL